MQLKLHRFQEKRKGLLSGKGFDFKLEVKVIPTREETDIIDLYNVNGHVLLWKQENQEKVPRLTISKAISGIVFTADNLPDIQAIEKELRTATEAFNNLLYAMPAHQGEETIEL